MHKCVCKHPYKTEAPILVCLYPKTLISFICWISQSSISCEESWHLVWTTREVLTPILPPTWTAKTDELVLKVALNLKENNIGHFYHVVSYWQKHIALYGTNNNGEVGLWFIFSISCQGKPQETAISLDSFWIIPHEFWTPSYIKHQESYASV